MNYFLLAETEFFRRINEAGDCNMEKAYTAFATQVIELCNGGMDMNLTVIALATTNIRQQRNRNHRQPSLDGQRHRPRGTYLRHRRDGLYQQRQYAAKTARPDSLQDIRY